MSHSHAKPVTKTTMTMKMTYSVIGTALSYFINIGHGADCAFAPRLTIDPNQRDFPFCAQLLQLHWREPWR
jgi:hypothetical protein